MKTDAMGSLHVVNVMMCMDVQNEDAFSEAVAVFPRGSVHIS